MEGSSTAAAPAKRAKRTLRVAAISGSLRRASANTGLIRAAAKMCEESIPGLQIDHLDISDLPLLYTDLETSGGFPAAVEAFRDRVCGADCFLFASPEYNYSISGPLKNALDWGSRPPNVWADRAAAIVSASGKSGGKRMAYHVRQVGVFLDIHFINKPEGFVQANHPRSKFDGDGNLVDRETEEQLRKILLSLQANSSPGYRFTVLWKYHTKNSILFVLANSLTGLYPTSHISHASSSGTCFALY